MKRRFLEAAGLVVVLATLSIGVVACGGGGSDSSSSEAASTEESESGAGATSEGGAGSEEGGGDISIDVGSKAIELPAGTKPKIAVFGSSGVAYQEVSKNAAEEKASELGLELTFFDAKFEPTTQLNQIQNALSTGEYNTWIFEDYSAEAACPLIQKAIDQDIVIVQQTNPTCKIGGKPANEEAWLEGTLATTGGATTSTYYDAFGEEVAKLIKTPEPEVALLTGPEGVTSTALLKHGVREAGKIPLVEEINTGYTTPEGLAETQTLLQAHPDTNVIISTYSDLTVGIVRAIEAAGKTGEIEVFDLGGTEVDAKFIKEGKLELSAPYFPKTVAETSVEVIAEAFEGTPTERFLAGFAAGEPSNPFFVTKKTVGEFETQY